MRDLSAENSSANDLPAFDLTRLPEWQISQMVGEKFLVFSIDEKLFPVSSSRVAEVTVALPVTALPNAPEWLLGLANLRGEVLAVVNLSKILGEYPSNAATTAKFIVLRSRVFEGGVAFRADKINEIAAIARENISIAESEKSPHVYGRTNYKEQILNFIDTEKVLASLKI